MKRNLLDVAKQGNSEARDKVDESIESEVFVFRAQMILEENEALLMDGNYDAVISNSDRVFAIIAREGSLRLMDEIRCSLSLIKAYTDLTMVDQTALSVVKTELKSVEDEVPLGNLYKTKSDLASILERIEPQRRSLIQDWGKQVVIEMNGCMDGLSKLYREFPKQFFEFEENPVHILTSYMEDVIAAWEGNDLAGLDASVMKFYLFYYQTERFIREEKEFRENGVMPAITRIDLPEASGSEPGPGAEAGAVSNALTGTPAVPAATSPGDVVSDTPAGGQPKYTVSDITTVGDELKGIFDELKAIADSEPKQAEQPGTDPAGAAAAPPAPAPAKMEVEFVGDTPVVIRPEEPVAPQVPAAAPVQPQAPPVQTPPVQTPPVQTPPVQAPPVQAPTVQTPPVQKPPARKPPAKKPAAKKPPKAEPPAKKPPKKTPPVKAPPKAEPPKQETTKKNLKGSSGTEASDDASSEKEKPPDEPPKKKPKLRTLIKDLFKKKDGKKHPTYSAIKKKGDSADDPVAKAKESINSKLAQLEGQYSAELKKVIDSSDEDRVKLAQLDAVAEDFLASGDLERAIVYYDAILKIDLTYKDIFDKRDDVYDMALDKLLDGN